MWPRADWLDCSDSQVELLAAFRKMSEPCGVSRVPFGIFRNVLAPVSLAEDDSAVVQEFLNLGKMMISQRGMAKKQKQAPLQDLK